MTNSRKGRGLKRSSIAPPYRLRRSVPPPDVVRSRDGAVNASSEEPGGIEAEDHFGDRDTNERQNEQIDGSIKKNIEDFEQSSPMSSQPQRPSDGRVSDRAETWDEPGSRVETETSSPVPEDGSKDESADASRDMATISATQSQSPKRAIDDSTAEDFFDKSAEDSASEHRREQSTDAWESEYEPMPASRGSKRASYIIYSILSVVLVALGGFYLYGGPDEPSKRSPQSRVRPEEGQSASDTPQTASRTADRVQPKSSAMKDTESDKTGEATQADPNSDKSKGESVSAVDETGATEAKTAEDDESSQVGENPPRSEAVVDSDGCCGSIEEYQEALRLNPNDTDVLGKLAYFYLNKGMNTEARRFAERTVNIDPKSSTGWIVLGAAFDAMNDHNAALEAYKTCAEHSVGKYVIECRNLLR